MPFLQGGISSSVAVSVIVPGHAVRVGVRGVYGLLVHVSRGGCGCGLLLGSGSGTGLLLLLELLVMLLLLLLLKLLLVLALLLLINGIVGRSGRFQAPGFILDVTVATDADDEKIDL